MPIYPPRNNPTRKIEILENRIHDFLKSIRKNCSKEKIANKAEKVKVAKLNLIKARLKLLEDYKAEDSTESKRNLISKLNLERIKWQSISYEEINDKLEGIFAIRVGICWTW